MWLREYTSLSPLSTNHRLCQMCRRDPHFMRYPLRITFVLSSAAGWRDEGDAGSVDPDACGLFASLLLFIEYDRGFDGELSSESEDVRW